jgi:hypothetical protein
MIKQKHGNEQNVVLAMLMLNGNATEIHKKGPITMTTINTTTNFCTLLLSQSSFSLKH